MLQVEVPIIFLGTVGFLVRMDGRYVLKFDSFVGGEEELDMENVGALVVE
jgi:hypothetical protein